MDSSADLAPIVWFAGVNWDAITGTDYRLVAEIAQVRPVVWIDPARRDGWSGWLGGRAPAVTRHGAITRVRVPATAGVTRFPARWLTSILRRVTLARIVRSSDVHAIVVANPIVVLPRSGSRRILYITDDWPAGGKLMGLSPDWLARTLSRNARRADAVAAVSTPLLGKVADQIRGSIPSIVLPNGAPPLVAPHGVRRRPIAGVVGQINERTDLALLEAVVRAGIRLRIIGPLATRDVDFSAQFSSLVDGPLVEWVGAVPAEAVQGHLAEIAVGLTPYTSSVFNMASSPLKTLEYLASGLPVVSSDMPASRWLNTPHVVPCSNAVDFVAAVRTAIERRGDMAAENSRRALALKHSWAERASAMLDLVDQAESTS